MPTRALHQTADVGPHTPQGSGHADRVGSVLRVVKKLAPGQPGTKKLLARHGAALLCVRYRQDALKLYRYTTIELVVQAGPLHPARFDAASFGVHLERHEHELRRTVKLAGARWDPVDRLWWMRGTTIRKLGLVNRIRDV